MQEEEETGLQQETITQQKQFNEATQEQNTVVV